MPDLALRRVDDGAPRAMRRALSYAVALLYAVAAAVFTLTLGSPMERNLFLLFYAAVCAAAVVHGIGPALAALAATILALDWWFMAPIAAIGIASPVERVRLAVYVFMSGVIIGLAEMLRRARARAASREASVRASERRYRAVLEEAADAIMISDADGNYLEVNERACALIGYTREELLGRNARDLMTPASLEAQPMRIGELTPGGRLRMDREMRRANGEVIPVEVNATMLDDGRVLAIARDLTDRRRLQERMLHSQKMEAVGRLAGGVAHDLNNILTVITTYSELLLSSEPAEWDREDLQEIAKAADRASGLTRKLLTFSRKQLVRTEVLDLDTVVREAEGMVRALVGPEIALEIQAASMPWRAGVDRGQLEQVLVNLVVNARDAMPHGGRLRIATGRRLIESMTEDGLPKGEFVTLTVTDTGVGMDADTQAHIFEPFFTTKPAGRGTGLGLATVYGIVTHGDGHVRVRSAPGEGATFTVLLARARLAATPSAVATGARKSAEPETATILVVDDESAVLTVTERILTAHGHRVLVAPGPVAAMDLSAEWNGRIDVLLTDLRMPVMNGRELSERLVQDRPELAVLFMSGFSEDPVIRAQVAEARQRLLAKPFTSSDLVEAVAAALRDARGGRNGGEEGDGGIPAPADARSGFISRRPAAVR